jgi:hypothetical protein
MLLVAQAVVVVLKSIALKIQIFLVQVSSGLASLLALRGYPRQ